MVGTSKVNSSESTWVISGRFLMYIHNYTCTYTHWYVCWPVHRGGSRGFRYVRAYTHVAGWHTSEGDFTSLLSVVVDRGGSRLEHRGDKDFPWHLGGC